MTPAISGDIMEVNATGHKRFTQWCRLVFKAIPEIAVTGFNIVYIFLNIFYITVNIVILPTNLLLNLPGMLKCKSLCLDGGVVYSSSVSQDLDHTDQLRPAGPRELVYPQVSSMHVEH